VGWVGLLRAELGWRLADLEPGVVHARDAVSLMEAFAEIERLAAAGEAAMAARVAATSLWGRGGDRTTWPPTTATTSTTTTGNGSGRHPTPPDRSTLTLTSPRRAGRDQ
jgi:hypothetical protein